MTRINCTYTYNQAGELIEATETPWGITDYSNAIATLESQITPRRIREALTDVKDAKAWLIAKEAEIQALRDELKLLQ